MDALGYAEDATFERFEPLIDGLFFDRKKAENLSEFIHTLLNHSLTDALRDYF